MNKLLRDKTFNIRATTQELSDWQIKANQAGLARSELIRQAMSRTKTWTVPNIEIENERNRQIARIGNNANQIARACNTYKEAFEVLPVLISIRSVENYLEILADVQKPQKKCP